MSEYLLDEIRRLEQKLDDAYAAEFLTDKKISLLEDLIRSLEAIDMFPAGSEKQSYWRNQADKVRVELRDTFGRSI